MLVQTHGTLQFKKPAAPPVTESITLTPSTVNFDADGNPTSSDEIYVEATGYWYTAPLDIGDGIFSYADPGSNTGNLYTYIFCEYNDL
jgi:hypothetical protein